MVKSASRFARVKRPRARARQAGKPAPPRLGAPELGALRDALDAAGYREEAIAARLGLPHVAAISLERYPVYRARLAERTLLDVATDLFLLQGDVARAEVEQVLGADLTARALAAGLLEPTTRAGAGPVAAAVSIYPCAGGLFLTDHRFHPSRRLAARAPREPVMYLGGDSYALAYLTPRGPVRRALDLCTGSGVHAILAARHAERVTAVDREPRALAFARLNARLNGVEEKVTWLRGDLYGPLAPDARFDLILANPPFVPSPNARRARSAIAFRDAGEGGEDVLARLLAGVQDRLERDGLAAVVSVFAERAEEPYRSRLEGWLGRRADLGALLVRFGTDSPAEYAQAHTRRPFGDAFEDHAERHARWLAALERAKIRRLAGGILALRTHGGPTPPWFRTIDAPWPLRAQPGALDNLWRASALASTFLFRDELLERSAALPADLVLTTERERPRARPDGAGAGSGAGSGSGAEPGAGPEEDEAGPGARFRPVRHRARAPSMLAGEVGLSPELAALLERCDGGGTLGAALGGLAQDLGADPAALRDRLFPDVVELVARGLLILEKS